jgi:hypothetical protein
MCKSGDVFVTLLGTRSFRGPKLPNVDSNYSDPSAAITMIFYHCLLIMTVILYVVTNEYNIIVGQNKMHPHEGSSTHKPAQHKREGTAGTSGNDVPLGIGPVRYAVPIGPPIRCFASTYITQARPLTSNTSPSYLPCVSFRTGELGFVFLLFYFITGKPILCLAFFYLLCCRNVGMCHGRRLEFWQSRPWDFLFVSPPARVERRDKVNRRSSSIWNTCLMCRGGGSRSESKDPLRRWWCCLF